MCYHTVHSPIEGKKEIAEQYRKKLKPGLRHQNAHYAAMVQSLDESVGRIMEALARQGIAERTVVIFTSDNGGVVNRVRQGNSDVKLAAALGQRGRCTKGGFASR